MSVAIRIGGSADGRRLVRTKLESKSAREQGMEDAPTRAKESIDATLTLASL
jgi:hypothetical protein